MINIWITNSTLVHFSISEIEIEIARASQTPYIKLLRTDIAKKWNSVSDKSHKLFNNIAIIQVEYLYCIIFYCTSTA